MEFFLEWYDYVCATPRLFPLGFISNFRIHIPFTRGSLRVDCVQSNLSIHSGYFNLKMSRLQCHLMSYITELYIDDFWSLKALDHPNTYWYQDQTISFCFMRSQKLIFFAFMLLFYCYGSIKGKLTFSWNVIRRNRRRGSLLISMLIMIHDVIRIIVLLKTYAIL